MRIKPLHKKLHAERMKVLSLFIALPLWLTANGVSAQKLDPFNSDLILHLTAQGVNQPSEEPENPIDSPPSDSDSPPADPTAEDPNPSDLETAEKPRFTCQLEKGQPTVMYHPRSQPDRSYPWAIPSAMGGGWSPERRCNEISRRLESYRPDGLLELQTGQDNGYNVICVTTEKIPECRIVLTIPAGEDPDLTRERVFANLTIADSGESTQGVNTFTNGSDRQLIEKILGIPSNPRQTQRRRNGIYLKPFLDRLDGGTGTQLRIPNRPNRRLNPGNFR